MPGHNFLNCQLAPGGHLRLGSEPIGCRLGDPDERNSGGNLETLDRQSRVRRNGSVRGAGVHHGDPIQRQWLAIHGDRRSIAAPHAHAAVVHNQ